MPPEVFDAAVDWIDAAFRAHEPIELTFHGGEPLAVGLAWYERTLPILRRRLGSRLRVHIQSNLWELDDEHCALFKEYGLSLGTSLDGPEDINDRQRGGGYFARTMAGIETAQRNGLDVGVICTFTRVSAPYWRQVCDFFAEQRLNFSVHAAVCALDQGNNDSRWSLAPREHGELLVKLFDFYLGHASRVRMSTFDAMVRGIPAGMGGLCIFCDCLGGHLAVEPDGGIFPCNRLVHHPDWRLGDIRDRPNLDSLERSPAWRRLRRRELTVHEDCDDCPHFDYCKGGCAYNALTNGGDRRDPYCPAYKRLFDHITARALEEVFSQENLGAVVQEAGARQGLLRKGTLLQIMRGRPHPQDVAQRARKLAAAVALAVGNSLEDAVGKLDRAGLVSRPDRALGSLRALREELDRQSRGLANAYIHVTHACDLACTHCYSSSGPRCTEQAMDVRDVARLVREAASSGFRKAVITGGEPLMHPQREALLDTLSCLRKEVKPLEIVLRTNLASRLTPSLARALGRSADQIVVSLDGGQTSHDARRGRGTYTRTVAHVRRLLAKEPSAEITLAGVMTAAQIAGAEGRALRDIAAELGVRVRFKPVLPIGRAAGMGLTPELYCSVEDGQDSTEVVAYRAHVAATCGLGMNLSVSPGGECFPCYALLGGRHALGRALEHGLVSILASKRFQALKKVTVDSNQRCGRCALRYLCGGFCRAWASSEDPDSPPMECSAIHQDARALLLSALESLNVSVQSWLTAGLPVPDSPPPFELRKE